MKGIGIIGTGALGTALAIKLDEIGYKVTACTSLNYTSAEYVASRVNGCQAFRDKQEVVDSADIFFITTPDDVIAETAFDLNWREGQCVVHCSGAVSLDALEPARQAGASVGSFHPIQSFSSIDQAIESLSGSVFAVSGVATSNCSLVAVGLAILCSPLMRTRLEPVALLAGSTVFWTLILYQVTCDIVLGIAAPEHIIVLIGLSITLL